MRTSWRIGTAFGIGIYIHWSFLLLPLYFFFQGWSTAGLEGASFAVSLLFAIVGCLVLHELGHALMARRFGIGTRHITLYPIGGVASLEGMGSQPMHELLIALAGPAVNVAIAAILSMPVVMLGQSIPGEFLMTLLIANLVLVGFNLLPAFPMDGGRVLRALLTFSYGKLRATEIATGVAKFVALGFAIAPLSNIPMFSGNFMLLVIAGFIYLTGQQELAMLRRRQYLREQEPIDVLPVDDSTLGEIQPAPVPAHFSGFTWDQRLRTWIWWRDGRPIASYSAPAE